jgi:hypothetical protein
VNFSLFPTAAWTLEIRGCIPGAAERSPLRLSLAAVVDAFSLDHMDYLFGDIGVVVG